MAACPLCSTGMYEPQDKTAKAMDDTTASMARMAGSPVGMIAALGRSAVERATGRDTAVGARLLPGRLAAAARAGASRRCRARPEGPARIARVLRPGEADRLRRLRH